MLPSVGTSERNVLAVIPARYGSTRLPGKVVMQVAGKPIVQHVYERACRAQLVDEVVVATDDDRVVEALRRFGTNVVMTRADHPSGTDRIAEVAASATAEIIVNVQGCEAIIDPRMIDEAIRPLLDDPSVHMATLKHRIADESEIDDPHVVKVVTDKSGRALYFSRAPIPAIRDAADREARSWCYFKHIGLYVYRREFLLAYAKMDPTPVEKLEKLEQLRALENGFEIVVVQTQFDSVGVDTIEAFQKVKQLLEG
jgi:3-deoxy-manno-octulosonate cytidylyltransferase (CMP-KDO synthetase)